MEDLWAECKVAFYEAENSGKVKNCAILCKASLLANSKSKSEYVPPLNAPLVNFLLNAQDEGYDVHVYAISPNASYKNLQNRGVDMDNFPFDIESHIDLLAKSRGLVISDAPSKRKDNNTLVSWDITDDKIQDFLNEYFSDKPEEPALIPS